MYMYMKARQTVREKSRVTCFLVLECVFQWSLPSVITQVFCPAFYVATDHLQQAIVVAIRGSLSIKVHVRFLCVDLYACACL